MEHEHINVTYVDTKSADFATMFQQQVGEHIHFANYQCACLEAL